MFDAILNGDKLNEIINLIILETRRIFIEKVSKLSAISMMPYATVNSLAAPIQGKNEGKKIRIGIIGAENSHTIGYGKLFNIDKKFPGVELKYVWGEKEEYAKEAMEKGGIPNMVQHPNEMLGKIDALIVDHRHGKFHLEAAIPFVKNGIPTFIDKPFCYRLEEGKKFLLLAENVGTPVTSYSSISHSYENFDIKEQVKNMGEINQVVRYGPLDMESIYGGVFFYGAHLIQPLMYIFGDDITKVRINKNTNNSNNSSANLVYGNGMLATLIFTTKKYGWQTYVETKDGIIALKSRVKKEYPDKNDVDMVNMFKTGIEPRTHQSILKGVAILEALEKSVISDQWEEVVL